MDCSLLPSGQSLPVDSLTGDERHDRPEEPDRPFNPSLDNISPKAPDFSLNTIRDPRQYANLLLGGGNNRWANVDLAAAFATVVTGTPILAHATMLPSKQVLPFERESFAVSELLKRGLTAVAMNNLGTAHAGLSGTGALAAIGNMGRVQIYAKTGTLRTRKDRPPTSRILIALVVEALQATRACARAVRGTGDRRRRDTTDWPLH